MADKDPIAELQPQFSSPGATPTSWSKARGDLEEAQIYWLSTVRPDGRPHVTPLFAIWLDGALYFCTGPSERKAKNLVRNSQCIITTGCNVIEGLDVVVEGEAVNLRDETKLQGVADRFAAKYGWHYTVRNGAFYHEGAEGSMALVYEVTPTTVFGFGKGEPFSQTRWRF